jgi:acyl carrier protein
MNELDAKLLRCFQAVFPNLGPDQVPQASAETLQAWDSVAMINLLNIIAEEFGIEVDWENFQELTSYAAIRRMVNGRLNQAS